MSSIESAPPLNQWGEVLSYYGSGTYTEFAAGAEEHHYGRTAGYESLDQAQRSLSYITEGEQAPAAAILEHEGRYYARPVSVSFDYDDQLGGYRGLWHLEQYPDDVSPFVGDYKPDGSLFVHPDLRMLVDGDVAVSADEFVKTDE